MASNPDLQIDLSKIGSDLVLEFLEAAFHNILYVRQLYPAGVFSRRKKYDVPIQICIHPQVSEYIHSLLDSLKPLLDRNEVEYIAFVVLPPGAASTQDQQPIERFVFDLNIPKSTMLGDDKFLLQIEQALRSFLLKLNVCDSVLKTLPDEASWTVQVKTQHSSVLELQEQQTTTAFQWLPADPDAAVVPGAELVPLRAMDARNLKMQLYVEEGASLAGGSSAFQ